MQLPAVDRWLVGALLLFSLLGFWFSMIVPPFETPDEHFHYGFTRHLAQGNGLPVQSSEITGPWEQEGSQAPLYYMLVGWLTGGIDQSDFAQFNRQNERANIGDPQSPGNKNYMLYSARRSCLLRCTESALQPKPRPLTRTNLALHIGRWFSLFLGAVTLCSLYATAKLAFPQRPLIQIVALFSAATLPQFVFISASLSNDSLIIATSALVIYWLARLLSIDPQKQPSTIDWLILGLLLGVAALSKLQGLGLWPLAALVALWLAWQRRDWKLPLRAIAPVALPALLICGWWYWRNYTLYGDWLGIANLLEINGGRAKVPSIGSLWGELRGLRYSFWGIFGWFNILLPNFVYQLLDLLTIVALVGLIPAAGLIFRNPSTSTAATDSRANRIANLPVLFLLLLWALLSLALLVYWSSQAIGSQGRLLFPAITAFMLLLILGLSSWAKIFSNSRPMHHLSSAILPALPLLLLASSLYALIVLIPKSYYAATPIDQLPANAQLVDLSYGDPLRNQDRLHLLGFEIGQESHHPGERIPIMLYLAADDVVQEDYQIFIQLLNDLGTPVANLTTHPGWGKNPTTLWRPGAIYADPYAVLIDQPIDPRSPLLAQLYVGFVDPTTEETGRLPLDAFNAAGEQVVPILQGVTIRPNQPPTIDEFDLAALDVQFSDGIRLIGFSAPDVAASDAITLSLQLMWEATAQPEGEYTAYVHLIDEAGEQISGFDQPPAAGRFPTNQWRKGDHILSEFILKLPDNLASAKYKLWVGLYAADSGGTERLPVVDAGALQTQENRLLIQEMSIASSQNEE